MVSKKEKKIKVLRLGHRVFRDKRITTHCCLVARAFGAERVFVSGEEDNEIVESVENMVENWGGSFRIGYVKSGEKKVRELKKQGFKTVHLTVYGEKIQERIKEIRGEDKVLVVVGGEKVPGEFYELADYNLSVSSQPHSEVAALAVFLHEFFEGKELDKEFKGRIRVEPSKKGKKIKKFST